MKRLAILLLLVLPTVGAANTERSHVHDHYEVPYNVQLGGIGGDLFQGVTNVYVTYDPALPDSDEFDNSGTVTSLVTVTVHGPGSNIVAATASSSVVLESGCGTTESVASSSGVATTRSHHTQTWRVTFDQTTGDHDKCEILLRISNAGPVAYVLDVPVTFYNDDGSPRFFPDVFAADVFEWLVLFPLLALLGLFLWSRKDVAVQGFGITLVLFDAVLLVMHYLETRTWGAQIGLALLLLLLAGYMGFKTIRHEIKKHGGSPI